MKNEGDKSVRQIWEKETKLTKEEVHERLEKYFILINILMQQTKWVSSCVMLL